MNISNFLYYSQGLTKCRISFPRAFPKENLDQTLILILPTNSFQEGRSKTLGDFSQKSNGYPAWRSSLYAFSNKFGRYISKIQTDYIISFFIINQRLLWWLTSLNELSFLLKGRGIRYLCEWMEYINILFCHSVLLKD